MAQKQSRMRSGKDERTLFPTADILFIFLSMIF